MTFEIFFLPLAFCLKWVKAKYLNKYVLTQLGLIEPSYSCHDTEE